MEKITGQDLTGARNNLCNEKLMFLTVPQKKKKVVFSSDSLSLSYHCNFKVIWWWIFLFQAVKTLGFILIAKIVPSISTRKGLDKAK